MAAPSKPAAKSAPHSKTVCAEGAAGLMIQHLLTRLEVEATKAGGSLSASQIRTATENFLTHDLHGFGPVFQRTYDECTQRRDQQRWSGIRKQPFDRILMKKFAHLFPPRSGDDGGLAVVSRRIIPGFNLAVNKMIGPTLHDQCQRKTRAIMDRHILEDGYDWDAIYTDREAVLLANDVLLLVAHYFGDFHKRRSWFMEMINGNLAPPDDQGTEDAHWQLTQHGFAELMRALFADLRRAAHKDVSARYGEHSAEALAAFFGKLD